MKKLIYGCVCLCLLASCNVKDSKEYKELQAQRDSLLQKNSSEASEVTELMAIVNEVEDNFSQIKEAEKYLTVQTQTKGELNSDTKARISENFNMIKEILKKNKEDLDKLNKRLGASKGEMSGLRKTLDRLNKELEERSATILQLQNTLAQKDQEIANLNLNVDNLSRKVDDLSDTNTSQAGKISEQDKALNTAYYVFGTSKELKEHKIISGGFLSSTKVLKDAFDKNYFIKVDIRDLKEVPVYAKKGKLLSNHPEGSYVFEKDNKGELVLKIKDYKSFWSLGQFLVVQVN
jgi:chromosome segregation ATPase